MTMVEFSHYLDFFTKLLFGANLSFAFSGITRKTHIKEYSFFLFFLVIVLHCSLFLLGEERTISFYPLLIHLPIILFLHKKMKVSLLHSLLSLFLAFQFLSPRTWFGMIGTALLQGDVIVENFATVLLSIPLSFLIERYFAPEIVALKNEDSKIVMMIGLAPVFYYLMTYGFVIYFDFLEQGGITLLHLLDGSFVLVFIIYTVFSLKIYQDRKAIEVERGILLVMQQAGQSELQQLHKQQEIMQIFRHDLRHHTHYLISLLESNQMKEAIEYTKKIMEEQDNQVLYASDESVGLLLSQYEKRGKIQKTTVEIHLDTYDFSGFDQLHLCGLISNGMENALKFSKDHQRPYVFLEIVRTNHQLTVLIKNTYTKLPEFHNSRPVTKEQGHGFGTKSMACIVEEYEGFCQFYLEDEYFMFRATLMAKEHLETANLS